VRIDLHTHSDRSDGTVTPRELVLLAKEVGLDVVALTDHDTAEGWAEATVTAEACGITLVPGIEISCALAGQGVHLLAYLPDPAYPPLGEALSAILAGRDQRMPRICANLRDLGIPIEEAEVVRLAGSAAALGRPHVADTLVSMGVVADRREAFDRYLSPGRPAYVRRYAPPVKEVIRLVAEAGGVSVLAHPWGRSDNSALLEDGLAELRDAGLGGLEVDHQDHSPAQRHELRAIARSLGLVVTGSSDFHGDGKLDHDLGCNTTDPAELDRLLELASAQSRRQSARDTPDVVRP
jgi:3',5'-nucleoside bisphosphate phosphatase